MAIRGIEPKELRKIGRPGLARAEEAPPVGIAPILRASWKFARETAQRFSKELGVDRTQEFLKNLAKRFS
ncbi:hypothetical protein A2625_04960 [candidate division WOR-1 bacterium RIFCSPHIGHO2_01_FULL_53_15]|uniref:Uncharacterized protein n=1 Tax=candidate division WOR-1 bacterium RIFCSPHIGHO2_01_FULL_53_15 TaxID=1802564 RepID=A0A1F4PZI6_UNCSA|nr:MAG: hypothetical protein A2625_04960 [candidate division WOR-1 bacterium RIFCSPHIGHO2_01_FULL_53_15]OGC10843.1 MAG: hypothetical protein A3D23_05180 [candidate division WOR-1 bacterium RIFCSPHIGHO2_02_FULL_53_26]